MRRLLGLESFLFGLLGADHPPHEVGLLLLGVLAAVLLLHQLLSNDGARATELVIVALSLDALPLLLGLLLGRDLAQEDLLLLQLLLALVLEHHICHLLHPRFDAPHSFLLLLLLLFELGILVLLISLLQLHRLLLLDLPRFHCLLLQSDVLLDHSAVVLLGGLLFLLDFFGFDLYFLLQVLQMLRLLGPLFLQQLGLPGLLLLHLLHPFFLLAHCLVPQLLLFLLLALLLRV